MNRNEEVTVDEQSYCLHESDTRLAVVLLTQFTRKRTTCPVRYGNYEERRCDTIRSLCCRVTALGRRSSLRASRPCRPSPSCVVTSGWIPNSSIGALSATCVRGL